MSIYQKIDGDRYTNIYVVGDLHGCYDLLMAELDKVEFNKETDLLISVGDLIDRGKQNLECLQLLREKWFINVQGNHDQMAIEALLYHDFNMQVNWIRNGGDWFYSLPIEQKLEAIELLKICEKRPLVIELEMVNGDLCVIAHADYPSNDYEFGKVVSKQGILWSRDRLESYSEINIDGADTFIFGHTIVEQPEVHGNRLYIDTGAFNSGNLTLIKLE
ncbi:metallophosphoesterase [Mannheimia indoligenes]|uniref:metallophosphoesterase n=1 Tax=Mannheimia indoligenes TaxID=3103145 RepID=UPI002FE55BEA